MQKIRFCKLLRLALWESSAEGGERVLDCGFSTGVNYYTAEETEKILARIAKDAPPYSAPLTEWLTEARAYNGFFFLGI